MVTLKFYVTILVTILLSFVLVFNLVSAQGICETCMQDAPETCPLECTAPEPPPPSYPFCGDGDCNQDETCHSCFVDCGACEEETVSEELVSEELEETIAVTENISPEVNLTLTDNLTNINLTNISEAIVNESLQESNETEESKILIQVDKKREGMLNYLNKKASFFMFLTGFTAFIFIMIFILFRKRRKNENLLNQLSAYIKSQLNKGFDIETIRRKLIDAGHNPYTIERIIRHMESNFEINKK